MGGGGFRGGSAGGEDPLLVDVLGLGAVKVENSKKEEEEEVEGKEGG